MRPGRADVGSPEAADAQIAVADHLRRLLERALHAVPEDERLTRQAEICNALLEWLRDEQRSASVEPDDALIVPLTGHPPCTPGSTERRALDWLTSIGADVKVSYDTRTTRLHAKAWLFERLTGFSTAFIGSSNLTHSALLDGVEWNVRLAQASTAVLIEKFKAAFESYWADPDYEPYDPARDADRFDRAVRATSTTTGSRTGPFRSSESSSRSRNT